MSIYRDKKTGRWRFEFDHYIEGERVRRRQLLPAGFSRSEAEAFDRKESAALWSIAHGLTAPRRLVDEAVACYLRERAPQLKHGANVARELENFREWWTGRAIDDLPSICTDYATDQHGALKPATIRNRIAYLRAACRWAWKRHAMADSDPAARVVVPTVRNAREVIVSRAEMLGLASLCGHRGVRATIRCLWYSGLRLGELRAAARAPGLFVLQDTKNSAPRIVPIHPRIRAAALVPVPPHGTLHYWWRLARQLMGLEHVTLHDLRHSAASEMIATGASLGDVGAVLGHKSPASTKRYAHWQTDRLAEVVGRMGRKSPTTLNHPKAA
jgi:integrase